MIAEPEATPETGREAPAPRLKVRYRTELSAQLREELGVANVHQVPAPVKVKVNMGVGDAARDGKLIDGALRDLATITGQKPAVARARKSIAQFKLREGQPIGAHVTLRGDRMWEFLDRLLSVALPRTRDFRGLSPRQFDGAGNYTFGIPEQGDLPGDQLRHHGPGARHGHHPGHHRHHRRRGPRAPARPRVPLQGGLSMAKTGLKVKAAREPKFKVRGYTRCQRCGRARSVYRSFRLCRICLRELAHAGELPGITKSSW